ncbi:MAG: lysylphosphatidylglycerol synthase transmembrane domain-containing protein, partial [Desulfobacterales bacterium]|nr:lysylphosphatidylglycerol synthase transmembrane domain-containing protein [Desulfobacterales bacterium]
MNRNTTISLSLGTAISVAALYFAFRNIPLDDISVYLSSINYFWIIPAVTVSLSTFLVRALRWQSILEPVRKISFKHAFHPLMTGFMLNCILPGRIGEAARPAILMKNEKIPFSTGLATVAVERIFDIVLLVILFITIMAGIKIDPDHVVDFGGHRLNNADLITAGKNLAGTGAILVAGIFLLFFGKTRKSIGFIIMKLPLIFFFAGSSFKKKIGDKISLPALRVLENFSNGFLLIRRPRTILISSCYTLAIWLLSALSYYLLALGCPGINLSFTELTAVMIIVCFFIALPSAPGYWGLWEAGGIFAMSLFGVSAKDAAGYTLINHVIQMVPVII